MKKRWNGSLWKRKERVREHESMSSIIERLLKEQAQQSKRETTPVHTEFMDYCRSLDVHANPLTDLLSRQKRTAEELAGPSNDAQLRRKGFMP